MKIGWKKARLGEVCHQITDGSHFSPKTFDQGDFPYITVRDIDGDFIDFDNCKFISAKDYSLLVKNGCKPENGDLLFSKDGTVGKVSLVDTLQDFVVLSSLAILRPRKSVIVPTFLKYVLKNPNFLAEAIGRKTGVAIKRIILKHLKEIEISFPGSLFEQEEIVKSLDETSSAIEKAEANIKRNFKNARQVFESRMRSVFANATYDWNQKRLSEISLVFARGKSRHRPRNDKKLYGGKYPFIQTGDVRNSHKHIVSYTQTYNEIGLSQSRLWPKGTICITIAANIAETGILDFDSCFPDSMIGLIVDPNKADVNYTYYLLQYLKTELQLKAKGSAQGNINLGTFENEYFAFPSISEQREIGRELDILHNHVRTLEHLYSKKVLLLQELNNAVLRETISGGLTSTQKTLVS
jgi:type I restriction enzyme S subunit